MNSEYIKYQDNVKKHNHQLFALVWWWFLAAIFIIITIVALVAIVPMGVIIGIPCFFYLRFVIKKCKRCGDTWKQIKAYRSTHKPSVDIRNDTTYCFVAPFPTQEAVNKVCEVLLAVGEVKNIDAHHGVIRGKIRISTKKKRPVTIYVERNDQQCKVRACFYRLANDDWWDVFLTSLFEKNPGVEFGVTLANGDPLVAGVLNLRGDTKQVSFSQTSGGTSLGGFLVGGALFGDAGAIVGGLSGKQRTVTNSRTVFSDELLVRVIYTNGRLWEGTVIKGSQLYHEIMVNMK